MLNLENIINSDKYILLSLNGSDSLFFDGIMYVYTTTIVWIPLALALIYLLIKNNNTKNFLYLLLLLSLVILLANGITSEICKPLFARFRPTNDPEIMYLIDTVNGYRGGKYGFMSSHAANSFGVATFCIWLVRNRLFNISVIIWALLNSYTRIYLGVHYLGDIICGTLVGVAVGSLVYYLYKYTTSKYQSRKHNWISDSYTKSGYSVADIHLFLFILYGTFAIIPIISFILLGVKMI